jgi:outer membrane protein assembly factor BamB
MRKKALLGVAGVALAALAVGGGFVLWREHESRNVHGSSTEEFVTTAAPKPRPKPVALNIPWPMYGYDPARRRAPGGMHVRPPYRPIWGFRAGHLVEFPPAVAYSLLFFANGKGTLYAVRSGRGLLVWSYRTGRCTAASPAVDGRTVYMTFMNKPPCNTTRSGIDGLLVALDAFTGKVRWRRTIGPSETSPAVVNGVVYVGDWMNKVYAFTASTGRLRWVFTSDGKVKGGIAYSGGRVYFGTYGHHVYALRAVNGKQIWRASAQLRLGSQATFYSTPAVAYGRVYIGGTDGKVYSFGATSGKLRWSHGTGGYVYSSPAVWQKRVYVGSFDRNLYCFDAATGDVVWSFKANDKISGSPVVVDGVVYFSSLGQRTYGLDARSGKLLWSFPQGKYAGVVSDGKRAYLTGYGRVIGLKERKAR